MDNGEKEETPMLSGTNSSSKFNNLWNRPASISIPMESSSHCDYESEIICYTGPLRTPRRAPSLQFSDPLYSRKRSVVEPKQASDNNPSMISAHLPARQNVWYVDSYGGNNEHLMRSGQLGMCNDPYCTTCPSYSSKSKPSESKFQYRTYEKASWWKRKFFSFWKLCSTGVMNPHTTIIQKWNKFFVISCLVAIFVDPLFFLVLSTMPDEKCIVTDQTRTIAIVIFRCLTDFIYFLNMILQFRLAYTAPETRFVGAGELVDIPKKIALRYLKGFFCLDLFITLPLPQIIVLMIIPKYSGANNNKNLIRSAVLAQYIPRLFRFLPLLVGQSTTGFIFETAWANFIINLLTFMLSAHIVGSCWYLMGLERVNQCLRKACLGSNSKEECQHFTDCGYGKDFHSFRSNPNWNRWKNNENGTACFTGGASYGIYSQVVELTAEENVVKRYFYSLFWGFQQISTLAGNQTPSYIVVEVLFTMLIIALGLLLFAFLIGNMQNFLQALGRRKLDMTLRRRDVEQWIEHRRLPQDLRRKILEAERYNWAATRGVNEDVLLDSFPEDLQREIRRHLFKFVSQTWIFNQMDEQVVDAICERLKQKIFIKGSQIFHQGGAVQKMLFIVRGKLESVGEDGTAVPLTQGSVCGEELLTWYIEHASITRGHDGKRLSGYKLLSSRAVTCLSNVEAFSLQDVDLAEVTNLFARTLCHPRIQRAIRYLSPYWRSDAASRIQVVWRYRRRRLKRLRS